MTGRDSSAEFLEVTWAFQECVRLLEHPDAPVSDEPPGSTSAAGMPPWAQAVEEEFNKEKNALLEEWRRVKRAATASEALEGLGALATRAERYHRAGREVVAGVRVFRRMFSK
ncbi:hypothetical protein [Nannocystis bainbridge]|uniref:Uncharacterized protein n=1 Tax=Nannocystis bainbridge TaxID=2995303 RepID=A0ABT5E0S7_9BACT|nr:hypothetical protein [Nannocystis bainbridge]MDC0719430.1 hypothetical protein [Nannocystis bainbridge]